MSFSVNSNIISQVNEAAKAVTSVAAQGSNNLTIGCTSHGYLVGDLVQISGTQDYNGVFLVSDASSVDAFEIKNETLDEQSRPFTTSQTGSVSRGDKDFSGLQSLSGVTYSDTVSGRKQYDLSGISIKINGACLLNPDIEFLNFVNQTALTPLTVNAQGSILFIGYKKNVNGVDYYPGGTVVSFEDDGYYFWTISSLAVNPGATLHWYSGTIYTGNTLGVRNTGQFNILSNEARLIENSKSLGGARVGSQLRSEGSNSAMNAKGVTLDSEGIDGVKLYFLNGVNNFSGVFKRAYILPRNGTWTSPTNIKNSSFINNRYITDYRAEGTSETNAQPVNLTNVDVGSAIRCDRSWQRGFGLVNIFQQFTVVAKDFQNNPIESVKFFIRDTDNGIRSNPGGTAFRDNQDYLPDRVYSAVTNVSGQTPEITVLLAVKYIYDQPSGAYQVDLRSLTNTEGVDDYLLQSISYLHTVENVRVTLQGASVVELFSTQVQDTLITQTEKNTVDAYTTLDNAQELYDRAKSYLYDNYNGEQSVIVGRSEDVADLGSYNLVINTAAVSAFSLSGSTITLKSANFSGGTSGSGSVTVAANTLISNGVFANDITYSAGSGTTISNVTATGSLDITVAGSYTITNCNINELINSSGGNLILSVTNSTIDLVTNSGSSGLTVNLDSISSVASNSGSNISVALPTSLTINGLVSGSKVEVFESDSQNFLAGVTSSGSRFIYEGDFLSKPEVDYTVIKPGYIPIRVTEVSVATEVEHSVNMVEDRAYQPSSGLSFGSSANVNTSTKRFDLNVPSTIQNYYSFMVESWKDQASLRNITFPLSTNGPNSFSLNDGYEWDGGQTEGSLRGDGYRYVDTNGNVKQIACNITSQGAIPSGYIPEFAVIYGLTNNFDRAGPIDQVVGVYYNYGQSDYRNQLIVKAQVNGYISAKADVAGIYGTLEDQQYIIQLEPQLLDDFQTGNPGITGVTITNHRANPVSWNGKNYSVTINDANNNTAENIHRWINYNLGRQSYFQGEDDFNWPDMVFRTGDVYFTRRGVVEGSPGVNLKGVRVVRGNEPHPGFTRFQADDGTFYNVPRISNITMSGMPTAGANIRLQITNETGKVAPAWQASTAYAMGDKVLRSSGIGQEQLAGLYMVCVTAGTSGASEPAWSTTVGNTVTDGGCTWKTCSILYYNDDPGVVDYNTSYIDGEEFKVGDVYEVRFAELNGSTSFKTFEATGVVGEGGFSLVVEVASDSVYATNAVDGSSSTIANKFTPDYLNDEIDLDTNSDFAASEVFAFFAYTVTTSQGMYEFWGGLTAIDEANYRINNDKVNLYFNESAGFVKQTDSARIFRSDGLRPAVDPTTGGNGIEINWRNPVYAYELSGTGSSGGFTAGDRSDLAAVKSKTDSLNFTIANQVDANIQYVNDIQVAGTGAQGDEWGPQ